MKKIMLAIITISLFACNEAETKKTANTSLAVGTDFIRATLDGDFIAAETFLLKDSQNTQLFERYKKYYTDLSVDIKEGYKKASYNINKFDETQNDSTAIINYSNSYMKQPQNIKLVKKEKQWQVDFKYTTGDTSIAK
jgi:hypothetical protein